MQVLDDTNDALPPIFQAPASEHTSNGEIDGSTLPQLDEEPGTLRSTQKQLERRVGSVGRNRGTSRFAPINILPSELLVTIFTITVEPESNMVMCDNATLMLVCQYWNHLVNNTPSLWTKIRKTAMTPNASIIRALERSKDSPLEIESITSPLYIPPEDETAFLGTIFPHAHRWRKVTLWLREERFEPMASLSAPILESLSLSSCSDWGQPRDEFLDIFGGRPQERLQELFLTGIAVPWSPTTLCNLKVLDIRSIRRLGPSLDQLFSVISASPSLEALSLRDVDFSGGDSTLPPGRIHIPTLGKLCLQRIAPTIIIAQLLAAVHAPKCKFGLLEAGVQVDPFETLLTSNTSHFFDHMRSRADASTLRCDKGYFSSNVSVIWEGPWRIILDVDNIRTARRVLNWLSVSPEPNPPAVPLHLTISDSDPPSVEDILTVMAHTKGVHRVSFRHDTPVAGALRILTTSSVVEGGTREPFPVLKEILIAKRMDDDEWEHLLRMLRRRQGEREAMNGDQHLKPLRKVVFGEVWRSYDHDKEITEFRSIHWPNRLEEVRRLLGPEGELIWYTRPVTEDGVLGGPPAYED